MSTRWNLALAAVVLPLMAGCADLGEEETDGDASLALARATSESSFEAELAALEAEYGRATNGGGTTTTQTIRPQGALSWVRPGSLCSVLRPLRGFERAYFYYGAYIEGDALGAGPHVGMDFVYDLWNRQAAVFTWSANGVNIGTAASVGGGAYVGYGFGKKANVVDAWSGTFETTSASLSVPETKLGIDSVSFRSPDGSVSGVSIGASAGLSLSWPLPVTGQVEAGYWTPFDSGTRALATFSRGTRNSLETATAAPRPNRPARPYQYVQYERSRDLAIALLVSVPAMGGSIPASEVLAIDVLRRSGYTSAQLCPR